MGTPVLTTAFRGARVRRPSAARGLPGRQELRRMSLTDLLVWGVILGGFAAVATTVVWLTH
jgi:hypothetical protein